MLKLKVESAHGLVLYMLLCTSQIIRLGSFSSNYICLQMCRHMTYLSQFGSLILSIFQYMKQIIKIREKLTALLKKENYIIIIELKIV